jgi:hypothetical protein
MEEVETNFIDPFLLTLTLVCTILLILGNLYFLAHFSHHADSGFGSSSAVKFVVVSISDLNLTFI